MPMTSAVTKRAKSWAADIKADLRVEKSENDDDNGQIWSNQDIDPTPPEKRTWNWHNYLLYFIGTGFNNWQGGSSVIGIGLGWQNAMVVAFVAQALAGVFIALNSKAAARYHIGFPAVARSVYGMWGSSYQVAVRSILAAVWYATKTFEGASYLDVMLRAVFGDSYANIPNRVPASVGYETKDFLCYFIVWFLYIPLLFRRPHQMRWLFTLSCFISFPTIFGLFGYCMYRSGGRLSLNAQFAAQDLTTSEKAWNFIYALTGTISNGSPYIETIPDMARWSKTPWAPIPTTLFVNSAFTPMSAVVGILGTSALERGTGKLLWRPWDIMMFMLDEHWNPGARFGVFLLASFWAFQTLSQNVSSNLIPFGADVSMLWPRRITIIRGYLICHLLAWCICPWNIYASAETFLNFMGAYGIFMGPAVSIMLVEYYLISNGNVFVPSIYVGNRSNQNYWYHGGWNLQAYVAYMAAVGLGMIGFVNKVGADVPEAGVRIGELGWFLTFFTGGLVYWLINLVWPHPNVKHVKGLRWEQLAEGDNLVEGLEEEENRKNVTVTGTKNLDSGSM